MNLPRYTFIRADGSTIYFHCFNDAHAKQIADATGTFVSVLDMSGRIVWST